MFKKRKFYFIYFGWLLVASSRLLALDIPPAEESFRKKYIKEHLDECIGTLKKHVPVLLNTIPSLSLDISEKNIEKNCICRTGYEADALYQAEKKNREHISEEEFDYIAERCTGIFIDENPSENKN